VRSSPPSPPRLFFLSDTCGCPPTSGKKKERKNFPRFQRTVFPPLLFICKKLSFCAGFSRSDGRPRCTPRELVRRRLRRLRLGLRRHGRFESCRGRKEAGNGAVLLLFLWCEEPCGKSGSCLDLVLLTRTRAPTEEIRPEEGCPQEGAEACVREGNRGQKEGDLWTSGPVYVVAVQGSAEVKPLLLFAPAPRPPLILCPRLTPNAIRYSATRRLKMPRTASTASRTPPSPRRAVRRGAR
jgi:hypothetical protein